MSKKNESSSKEDSSNNDDLPMAIQIFLWRQTSPFIRPKFGKFHDATCVLCSGNEAVREIKEACKIFEKVLVQNIQFGLSPSFTAALQLIPRWRFIVATLPHVMHCAAAMLQHRKESSFNLGSAETKLLYTLHWILLDAADECALQSAETDGKIDTSPYAYLFPITAITTFVYLFAPICGNVRESDFMQNFRLENGKKIWQALWEHKHPEAECFTSPVKPRRHVVKDLKKIREKAKKGQHGVFLGEAEKRMTNLGGETVTSPSAPTTSAVQASCAPVESVSTPVDGVASAPTVVTHKPALAAVVAALKSSAAADKSSFSKSESTESASSNLAAAPPARQRLLQQQQRLPSNESVENTSQGQSRPIGAKPDANKSSNLAPGVPSEQDNSLATFLDVAVLRCLFISHWGEDGIYWALMFFNKRLKSLSCCEGSSETPIPQRKRSHSVPMPKIEITLTSTPDEDGQENDQKSPSGSIEPLESLLPARTISLGRSKGRKKSVMQNIEGNRFKNFKTFVESKILSKSDRSLELDSIPTSGSLSNGLSTAFTSSLGNGKLLDKKESFQRRRSHLSMYEIEMSTARLRASNSLLSAGTVQNDGKIKIESSTVENPDNILAQGDKDSVLVKGKSMPSLSSLIDELRESGYYGLKKGDKPAGATGAQKIPDLPQKLVTKPIITVTEFTPGNTPDKVSSAESSATGVGSVINVEEQEEIDVVTCTQGQVELMSAAAPHRLSRRSRTDSFIVYTPPSITEAPGSTFYIKRNGQIDNIVLLKALYKVALRENVCTLRVCDVLLQLLSTLIDLGLLANKSSTLFPGFPGSKAEDVKTDKAGAAVKPEEPDPEANNEGKFQSASARAKTLSLHNIFMDVVIRILKVLGCKFGCHEVNPGTGHPGAPPPPPPPAHSSSSPAGLTVDTLRSRGVALLSRLLWYDRMQFRQFLRLLVDTRDIQFLITFFHGYLSFCAEPTNPFSMTGVSQSNAPSRDKRSRAFFKSGQDLSLCYARNFQTECAAAGAPTAMSKGVESVILTAVFKKLVSKLVNKLVWLKSGENVSLYTDVRGFLSYVRTNHGAVYRRAVLCAMLDSTKNLIKTQCKIESREGGNRIPVGSYPHIESQESPLCSIADENETSKLNYKKSVFKKKSTSSTGTSLVGGAESPMTRGGSPAGSLNKKHFVLSPATVSANDNSLDRKVSRIQQALGWFNAKGQDDKPETALVEPEFQATSVSIGGTPEAQVSVTTNPPFQPLRKYSTYVKNNKIQKGASEKVLKMVKKIGITRGRRSKGEESDDVLFDLSRTNSYDYDAGMQRDSEIVYYRERHLVPIDDVRLGLVRFSFFLETSAPGTIPDPLLIAALLDLPKAPVVSRACYILECAHFVHQCNRGQWPSWLKMNLPTYRPSRGWPSTTPQLPVQRRAIAMQLQASKMFHQWAEMLGSRLEEILLEEQSSGTQATSLITDESMQRQLLQEDEEEDFLDEASLGSNNSNCPMALKLVSCVLLLEITTFLRETFRNLPRSQLTAPQSGVARLDPRQSQSHGWGEGMPPSISFGRTSSRDHSHHGTSASTGNNAANVGSVTTTPVSTLAISTTNNRRWSVAAQSVASVHGAATAGTPVTSQVISTPTAEMIPSATMSKLAANSAGSVHGERKISFVIQDDSESATSSQTTLAVQTEEEKKGVRITQGKPFLKRGPSTHSAQNSFRRRSIRLAKQEQAKRDSKRGQPRKDSDQESALSPLGVTPAPPASSGTSFAAVVLAAAAAAKEANASGQAGLAAGSVPADTAKPPVALRRPLPNARSRWKKLTGTAMFINRLALNRRDSNTSKRKVSSISISDNSDHEYPDQSTAEDSPGPLSGTATDEKDLTENALFSLPEEEEHLEQNMPWLRVITKLVNSFNFFCTHQGFCHPNCYRRQMRASKRIMEATRRVFGEEAEYAEDILFGVNMGGLANAPGMVKKTKSSGDSSSTSPDRSRKEDPSESDRRHFYSSQQLQQLQLHAQDKTGGSGGPTPTWGGYGNRKTALLTGKRIGSEGFNRKKQTNPSTSSMLKYLKIRVRDLFHAPFSVLNKSACILSDETFVDVLPVAWELLRETDRDVVGSAASIFIVASVKVPKQALDLISCEMQHQLPDQRINAVLRFQALWRNRHQVWQRLEENGQIAMKVVPSQIEFTLPSPKVGIESLPVVDPPWQPKIKTKISTIHDSGQMLLSATKSRKKQQYELVQNVIHAEEEKRRRERENYHITSVPVLARAAYEPSLYHGPSEEHDDVDEETTDQDRPTIKSTVHIAQSLFPSILCTAFLEVIALLEDHAVSLDGTAVYEVAYQVIWSCLVEDSNLFLKYFMEQLTRENSIPVFQTLRALIRFIPKLPQQAAFALYNYVIGYIMFYVRHPKEKSQELIGQALDTLWMTVHSVQGIMFKDLKQILRKEQVDASILLTANVPSVKKIIVHGPQGPDEGGIPSQFPIGEDVQFCQILREALDFFSIDEDVAREYFLIDHKTRMIHNPQHYVRDFYFFKRSQYPQLALVHKKPEQAYEDLQRECLTLKFTEIGKVMLIWGILKNVNQVVQRVVFLHEDLIRLPSFPRKALEAELDLHTNGEIGKELYGIDIMHKFNWIRLISRMFEAMAGNFAYSSDIHLFLNVINGSLALYAEDAGILRYSMAVIINSAHQFKNIFSNNGYFLVMPSLLRIYSNNQTNELITKTIEYVCKQLYILHRKPFLLQMFGSVAPILDKEEDDSPFGDAAKIQSKYLYKLLCSLSENRKDLLHIMELVKMTKPLSALDFCYQGDPENISVLECMSLCVLVVAYDSGTKRARQMLSILESILPYFLRDMVRNKTEPKVIRETIHQLTVAMKALINNCDELTKNYNGPAMPSSGDDRKSRLHAGRGPYSPVIEIDDESHSRYVGDSSRSRHGGFDDHEDNEWRRDMYCQPRSSVLSLISEFVVKCSAKLQEINKKDRQEKPFELLDTKCYVKLVDIAQSLIKMAPYDQSCIKSSGLQKYMNEVFPLTDWSQEALRPALATIIRRLDKFFTKIHKSVKMYHSIDWSAAAGLLQGIYATLWKHPYIVNVANLKTLIGTCQCLVVGESSLATLSDPHAPATRRPELPPQNFCSVVYQLVALQVLVLGNAFTLEQRLQLTELNHQGSATMHTLLTHDKGESLMLNLLLPLCLKVGSGRKDAPKMRKNDVQFSLGLLLNMLNSNSNRPVGGGGSNLQVGSAGGTAGGKLMAGSFSVSPGSRTNVQYNPAGDIRFKMKTSSLEIGFLGLKILLVCFESHLHSEWFHVARTIREMGTRKDIDNGPLWRFLDFVAMHRSPLYTLLVPFIHNTAQSLPESEHERRHQLTIRQRLSGCVVHSGKSKSLLLVELSQELASIRDSLNKRLQETYLDVSSGPPRSTPRGSHRTSFIDYVSEVYNSTKGHTGPHMEVLSVRGHSISSGSVASGSSSLARDISIRSENVQSNRVLGGRIRQREATKSARISGVSSLNQRNPRRRTSYGGEQTETIAPIMPAIQHSKGSATSEPKLFRKNTLLQRNRGLRQTVKVLQDHPGALSDDNIPLADKSKLQRQKAQSRKTFKFRKTRKDGPRMKTTSEALENGQDTGIELKVQQQQHQNQQPTVTLNPALHSAAANISSHPPGRGHTCVRATASSNGSRRPPALVFTHDSSVNSSISSPSSSAATAPASVIAAVASTSSSSGSNAKPKTTSSTVTFTDMYWEKSSVFPEPIFADDNLSISSRGTSSTIGYRDSFGENEDGCCRLQIVDSVPEKPQQPKAGSSGQKSASQVSVVPKERRSHHVQHNSPLVIFGQKSEESNSFFHHFRSDGKTEKVQTSASKSTGTARRRKNYIIFERNDEDTLI